MRDRSVHLACNYVHIFIEMLLVFVFASHSVARPAKPATIPIIVLEQKATYVRTHNMKKKSRKCNNKRR